MIARRLLTAEANDPWLYTADGREIIDGLSCWT
jgi:adenosylmethionine-8-amino-7-oxononanoate aminotransferase